VGFSLLINSPNKLVLWEYSDKREVINMARPRKSIDVIVADGKKHLTKAEIEQRKAQESTIQPKNDNIKCPSWLDPLAKKEWKRIVNELIELGLLTNLDTTALAIYCDAYSKYLDASKSIQEHGTTVSYTNASGNTNITVSPYVQVQTKYADLIRKCASDLGLTVSSRLKITVPKVEKEPDEFEEEFGDI
jgi:P27 family predicted phage terminase small subunit